MSDKIKYWRGFEEFNDEPEFRKSLANEFGQELTAENFMPDEDGKILANRRDFLKYFGFGVSVVALSACNKTPVKNAIPYLVKPETITPGIPNWYSSTCAACNSNCGILVKTREGRPIKIEGNSESPIFKGGVCARGQAGLLGLYDNERYKDPISINKQTSWTELDARATFFLKKSMKIALVSGTINSPTTKKVIDTFIAIYPVTTHIIYEAISYSAIIEAHRISFGRAVLPSYNFSKADIIVSFGADFLGTWISPVEFTKQWSLRRKPDTALNTMSRHYQFETNLSISGAAADVRVPVKPSEEGVILAMLYQKLQALQGQTSELTTKLPEAISKQIDKLAKELYQKKSKSLLISGSDNLDNQLLIAAINSLLENIGSTIDLDNYSSQNNFDKSAFDNFVTELGNGNYDAIIFYNVNPVYSYHQSKKLSEAIAKIPLSISTSFAPDETSDLCKIIAPDNHYLESWNDFEPKKSYFSISQPAISKVFNTRQAQESLLAWSGINTDYYTYLKLNWSNTILDIDTSWNQCVHDGFLVKKAVEINSYSNSASTEISVTNSIKKYTDNKDNTELQLYTNISVGDGTNANNPWLQELPDPITKVCWDNYACIGKMLADKIGVKDSDLITISKGDKKLDNVPVLIQPGQANNTISIALGYGRTKAGKVASNLGKNAFIFTDALSSVTELKIEKVSGTYELARTQTHHSIEGRDIIRESTLADFVNNPAVLKTDKNKHNRNADGSLISLWDEKDQKGHHWAMAIDLNSCTGCSACVVSCNAENNVPVVGKDEVLKKREMHWIRLDRYYSFNKNNGEPTTLEKDYASSENIVDFENVKVNFQPVTCHHCGQAPCETVCPVTATVHSTEGLNQMTYNRCIGTRYCSNNCPYKVRRFNWFKYFENNKFDYNMNNDLGRMVLNPDVTVRSRGVMEKCSLCVQRIEGGKLNAKLDNKALQDGDIKTACQQSCPANAIVFGDLNNPESEVAKLFKDNRSYFLLEELNVKPGVAFMAKIRNESK